MKKTSLDKTAFFGEVTASVAHDLQNVLAIVQETSGLMQDILFMNKDSLPPEVSEKFTNSISAMKKHLSRGIGITSGLNRFAHTADSPEASIDICDTIEKLFLITKRILNHKNIIIEINKPSIRSDIELVLIVIYSINTNPVTKEPKKDPTILEKYKYDTFCPLFSSTLIDK